MAGGSSSSHQDVESGNTENSIVERESVEGENDAESKTPGEIEDPFPESEGSNSPEHLRGKRQRVMWKEKLRFLDATPPALVLEKEILEDDVNEDSNMLFLLMEDEEVDNPEPLLEFMSEEEKRSAERGAPLFLLDRKGDEYPNCWISHLSGTKEYAITGEWMEFVKGNQLQLGDIVDVFCFRVPPLCSSSSSGGGEGKWRLGMAVCSRTSAAEMVRRELGDLTLIEYEPKANSPVIFSGDESCC